jgi:hypothetical protein
LQPHCLIPATDNIVLIFLRRHPLQTTWAKHTLTAKQHAAKEREAEARVEAEKASSAEGTEQAEMDLDVDEEEDNDKWHDATKDASPPGHQAALVASLETSQLDVVHERDLAAVKAIIEERMAKLSRAIIEVESAQRAGRWAIGDLLTWRAEIFTIAHALACSRCPCPTGRHTTRRQNTTPSWSARAKVTRGMPTQEQTCVC